jgi:hypothetical protein
MLNQLLLNKLSSAVKLNHCVKVYVPSTVNANVTSDNTEILNFVASELSKVNGGATIQDVSGCWNSDEFGLIKEPVKVVYSYCKELTNEIVELTIALAEKIKSEMAQEMVSIELDSELYLI